MPVILGIEINDQANLKGLRRQFGRMMKATMNEIAQTWHGTILPKHFFTSARAKYGFEKRKPFYTQVIKKAEGVGQGKFIDLLLKGQSKRFLMAFAKITGSSGRATVTMRPPQYFTNPFIGVFTDQKSGKQRQITRQPDKVKEVTGVIDADRQALRDAAAAKLHALINEARQAALTKINA